MEKNLLTLLGGATCENVVDHFFKNPDKLVYRRIEHLFECDGEKVWYKGPVLSFNSENQQFTIAYDNEDDVFNFPLLEDLRLFNFWVSF